MDWLTCNSTDFLTTTILTRGPRHAHTCRKPRPGLDQLQLLHPAVPSWSGRPSLIQPHSVHMGGACVHASPQTHAPLWEIDSSNNRLAWPINGPSVGDPRALQPHSGLTLIKMNAGALAPSGECSSMLLATYRWLLWEEGGLLWWV